jgi:hypothetical protein
MTKQLRKEELFILAHGFKLFGSVDSKLVVRQKKHHGGGSKWQRLLTSGWQEAKR